MTVPYVLVVWAIVLALLLLWIAVQADRTDPGPPLEDDPYEGEIRQFRRQIHDWTRDN